jgi:hypothetical protein
MGWIKELEDVAAKSKVMKALIISAIVMVLLAAGSIAFFVLKAAFEGRPVKVASVELPENPDSKSSQPKDTGINQPPKSGDTPFHNPPPTRHKTPPATADIPKASEKKEPPTQSPMFDLRGANFYGPVAMGPNATQINDFRGKDGFHPLAFDIYYKVVGELKKLKNNHPEMPEIQLTNLSGSIATISAIDELKSMLDSAGIAAKVVEPRGTMSYGNSGFWAYRGSKDSAMISEFSRAITPFMTFKQGQFDDLFHGEHSFRIFFIGPAEYKSSGEVFIH